MTVTPIPSAQGVPLPPTAQPVDSQLLHSKPISPGDVPAIQARALCLRLPDARGPEVLHAVDLDIPAKAWTAVLGPNGAGKSSLLRCLAGLQAHQGHVLWQGVAPQSLRAGERSRRLAWLGSSPLSSEDLSVEDVVMLGRLPHQAWWGTASAQDHEVVQQALRQMDLWALRQRRVAQLSSGEQQRVLLARAWAVQAALVLLDEPLAHLDPPHQSDCLRQIRQAVQQGQTVVSVLHEVGLALWADHLVLMRQGRLFFSGPGQDPQTHRAIEDLFEQRLRIVAVSGACLGPAWAVLPHWGLN